MNTNGNGKEPEDAGLAVIRWMLPNGRSGKTAPMSRAEAEAPLRRLAAEFRRIRFEAE